MNRDFFRTGQDIGSINAQVQITPDLTLTNKFRASNSTQNYIGTLPEAPVIRTPFTASTISANPQSRYQATGVVANQTEATYKFQDGIGFRHTALAGVQFDRETISIDSYTRAYFGSPARRVYGQFIDGCKHLQSAIHKLPFGGTPTLTGRPTNIQINTSSVYALDIANYNDLLIVNGGCALRQLQYRMNGYGTVNGVQASSASSSKTMGCQTLTLVSP